MALNTKQLAEAVKTLQNEAMNTAYTRAERREFKKQAHALRDAMVEALALEFNKGVQGRVAEANDELAELTDKLSRAAESLEARADAIEQAAKTVAAVEGIIDFLTKAVAPT